MYWATTLVVSWEVCLSCALLVSVICVQKILCSCSSLYSLWAFMHFSRIKTNQKFIFPSHVKFVDTEKSTLCANFSRYYSGFLIIVAVKTVDLWCLYFTNVHLPGLFSAIFIFRNMEWIMQSSVYIIYLLDFSVFWISWLKLANSAIVWNVHIVTGFFICLFSVSISSKVKAITQSLKRKIVLLKLHEYSLFAFLNYIV